MGAGRRDHGRAITGAEAGRLLSCAARTAFHLETRPSYAIGAERADYERFLAGERPGPPGEGGWWQEWLNQVAGLSRQGVAISRVRILDSPRTDYQRWLLWTGPWQEAAGESIRYLRRRRAALLGLPLSHDWWLLDDECVTTTWFTGDGQVRDRFASTDPETVAGYRRWRDLATANAAAAEQLPAA